MMSNDNPVYRVYGWTGPKFLDPVTAQTHHMSDMATLWQCDRFSRSSGSTTQSRST